MSESSNQLTVIPIRTDIFKLNDDISNFIIQNLKSQKIQERSLIAITSKIVSLAEGRVLPTSRIDKTELIKRESDIYFGEIGYGCHLTVKHGHLIPSAGIDESNAAGNYYILFPEDPFESAHKIWSSLRERFKINNLGVIITDSRTTALRKGVTGTSLSHWGFKVVRNMIGQPDIFGRNLKMTQINVADALAGAAVYMMGESNEQCPLALLSSPNIEFVTENTKAECAMPFEDDLYRPLLEPWVKK